MNEQNKSVQSEEESSQNLSRGTAATKSGWKKLLARKWVFPAAYMAVAAIILTLMWVYQDSASRTLTDSDVKLGVTGQGQNDSQQTVLQPDAIAVQGATETMQWPVTNASATDVSMHFFDSKASNEVRQAAMVEYGETFTPHMGIDLSSADGKTFDVVAAMSGKVTLVEKHAIVGHQVEITHPNGLTTVYQSLSDVTVEKGMDVKKGDVIAKAGRNELEKDMNVHVHFEIRQGDDRAPLNPETFLAQTKN
jgi:stage II sporulation protein Q